MDFICWVDSNKEVLDMCACKPKAQGLVLKYNKIVNVDHMRLNHYIFNQKILKQVHKKN